MSYNPQKGDQRKLPRPQWGIVNQDGRSQYQKDRDKILYSTYFRRLADTTQVASGGAVAFHNRLTHTLEVAQIARRITERMCENKKSKTLAEHLDLSPDVAESAALAHDLGHPPFGHSGESVLNQKLIDKGVVDGFEGNAQTFRILSRLAVQSTELGKKGLNLSRATFASTIKYPWSKGGTADKKSEDKYGAYQEDLADFNWAREGLATGTRTPEADIMDFADDVAYALYDLYDFFRAGMIPLHQLVQDKDEFQNFVNEAKRNRGHLHKDDYSIEQYKEAWGRITDLCTIRRAFTGRQDDIVQLQNFISVLFTAYVGTTEQEKSVIELMDPAANDLQTCIDISPDAIVEIKLLKELTGHYVIRSQALRAIQHGQEHMLSKLFDYIADEVLKYVTDSKASLGFLPTSFEPTLNSARNNYRTNHDTKPAYRIAADIASLLTDNQAVNLYRQLSGHSINNVIDPQALAYL